MDERIIDRKLFIDLANEVGLNASHIEAMGEMRHCEITVSGNMLELSLIHISEPTRH